MRLLTCTATNFGSYPFLSFDFDQLGLSLIYGPTGSGKSTLLDLPCWVLYGLTSKEGSVDEVRSWQHKDSPTTGTLEFESGNVLYKVTRIRGKAVENDLYWQTEDKGTLYRGKDIKDTQRLLVEVIGVTYELYISGSYFHEFSNSSTFFVDNSKDKRALFEKIACLDLPALLADKASTKRKESKKLLVDYQNALSGLSGKYLAVKSQRANIEEDVAKWEIRHNKYLAELKYKSSKFEFEKITKIEAAQTKADSFELSTRKQLADLKAKQVKLQAKLEALNTDCCPTCGRSDSSAEIASLKDRIESCDIQIARASNEPNPYIEAVTNAQNLLNFYESQVKLEKTKENPFFEQMVRLDAELPTIRNTIEELTEEKESMVAIVSCLSQIYDMSFDLRGKLLQAAVKDIEESTNAILSRYFDAEIKVQFSIESSDSFEVAIQKSGYDCAFTQLSKGQRGLLKLCFSVAVMKAASARAGIHFATLFFDEALDGLDSDLKVKAFSLFQELELSHQSILLIDHAPEFQNLFTKKFKASLIAESTVLEEVQED